MAESAIILSGSGNAIRRHQESKGAAVMNDETVKAHLMTQFGARAVDPRSEPAPPSAPDLAKTIPFVLQTEEVQVGRVSRKTSSKKKESSAGETPPAPSVLVEYMMKLEGGAEVAIPEYAYLAKVDGEILLLGYPITKKDRFKPEPSSRMKIRLQGGSFHCYATGIHTDIPEWGVSLSVYLIVQGNEA